MTRWLRKLVGPFREWTKDRRDRLLARFRAHVALALADEFRQLAAAQRGHERQIHEMNLFVEVLAREIPRLQQQVEELAPPSDAAATAIVAYQGRDPPAALVA